MIWVALYSKTGSEIAEISKRIGKWPDIIITNKEFQKIKTLNKISKHIEVSKMNGYLELYSDKEGSCGCIGEDPSKPKRLCTEEDFQEIPIEFRNEMNI